MTHTCLLLLFMHFFTFLLSFPLIFLFKNRLFDGFPRVLFEAPASDGVAGSFSASVGAECSVTMAVVKLRKLLQSRTLNHPPADTRLNYLCLTARSYCIFGPYLIFIVLKQARHLLVLPLFFHELLFKFFSKIQVHQFLLRSNGSFLGWYLPFCQFGPFVFICGHCLNHIILVLLLLIWLD